MMPKLGLAGHKVDPKGRTLKLADFIRPSFAAPAACDLTTDTGRDTDDLGNVQVGCCAIAGPGHFVRWEDRICGRPQSVNTASVIDEYQAFGYVPGDETTDNGCYALDVMKRWRSVGLFGRRIQAFAQVDYFDAGELAKATFLLGGVFLCLSLPRRVAMGDMFTSEVWDVAIDDGGIAGGHLVWLEGSNLVNSWGQRIRVSDAFVARYCFDAYAVVSGDAVTPNGRAFSGLDLAGLDDALRSVTA